MKSILYVMRGESKNVWNVHLVTKKVALQHDMRW